MAFREGWGRIETLTKWVGILVTIGATGTITYYSFGLDGVDRTFRLGVSIGAPLYMSFMGWIPFLVAKIIGWIVMGFIGGEIQQDDKPKRDPWRGQREDNEEAEHDN